MVLRGFIGSPRGLLLRGSHRSERATLTHSAHQNLASLRVDFSLLSMNNPRTWQWIPLAQAFELVPVH
jgi:hypothetical protein